MGVGFTHRESEYRGDVKYGNPGAAPVQVNENKGPDVVAWIKGITAIIGTLVLLGGIVWGTASIMSGFASDEDVEEIEDRVELVEKNDLVQTVILNEIKGKLDKIEDKLDKALHK